MECSEIINLINPLKMHIVYRWNYLCYMFISVEKMHGGIWALEET